MFDGAEHDRCTGRKVRVLFYVAALNGGGAEKHLVRIINQLDRTRFEPVLVLARSGGAYDASVNSDVPTIALEKRGFLSVWWGLRWVIRQRRPHVVFSLLDPSNIHCLAAAHCLASRPKTAVGVQDTPSLAYRGPWWGRRRLLKMLMSALYPSADCVVASSSAVRDDLRSLSPSIADRCQVIYNAGYDQDVLRGAAEKPSNIPADGPLVVACGRLTEQKGFPDLLDALAILRRTIPAQLWLVGEGRDRSMLQSRIRSLRLERAVRLVGFQSNPFRFMAAADVFVLSSRWEGFGNVIVEAMACGTPVVATNCRSGPNEIIQDGVNGLLVPPKDPTALANALMRLLTNDRLKRRLSEAGKRRARDFADGAITRQYEQLFLHLAAAEVHPHSAVV